MNLSMKVCCDVSVSFVDELVNEGKGGSSCKAEVRCSFDIGTGWN